MNTNAYPGGTPLKIIFVLLSFLFATTGLADSDDSNCAGDDKLVVNEPANDACHTLSISAADTSGITIDGSEGGGEWSAAQTRNLSADSGHTGSFKILRSNDALFVLVAVNGGTMQASDSVTVSFDVLHNHATDNDDVKFRIVRDQGASPAHKKILSTGTVDWDFAAAGSELATTSAAGTWTAEMKITAGDLGVSDIPPIMGFGVLAQDPADTGALNAWPGSFVENEPGTTWANLKTRFPLEYMIVLDQSGSMLDPTTSGGADRKWDAALTAADYLANTLGILQNTVYFNDQLCMATFAWGCSGDDTTAIVKSCATLGSFPVGKYSNGVAEPVSTNCTPIGSGLDIAFNTLGTSVAEETQRVTLLLSDGLHNRPDSSLEPGELDYSACDDAGWTGCTESSVQVNTVALGEGGGIVDEALLSNIKDHFAGTLNTTYNITSNSDSLKEEFIGSLDDLYQMNFVYSGSAASDFAVDEGNQRLVVIASWTNPANATTFKVQRDDGGGSWVDVACDAASAADTTVGFGVCVVNAPAAGDWRTRTNADAVLGASRLFVLLDLNLRARFQVEQAVHGTGMDILLTADLNQGGVPLTNDASHPVNVTVDIEEPEQGMGTFLSTTDPEHCKTIQPVLPGITVDGEFVAFNSAQIQIGNGAFGGGASVGVAAGQPVPAGDPAAPNMQLAEYLLGICGLNHLPRNVLASVQLFDDGTHGDTVANDGVYSLRFANTEYEGSYVFRFNAGGTTLGGNRFSRTKATGEYVRVNVDPASSQTGNQVISQSGVLTTGVYFVIPRDMQGGYLGPGHLDQVKFLISGAQPVGGARDFNNGMYAQIVRYDASQTVPAVVPVVQDKPIPPSGQGQQSCPLSWKVWVLIILLALLALILLWLLILCRSRKR